MDALSVRELSKVYHGGVKALDGVSFSVGEGDFYALLGPNGAGKSTTIGIVAGLVRKTSGTVSVFGRDLDRSTMAAKSLIGLVPQDFDFSQFDKVLDVVVNQAGLYGMRRALARQRAEQILKRVELWEKRDAETRELSGGMKRRLLIARALAHNPKLLILDEPTAGVDINVRRATWDLLRLINRSGTAIILTTHYLEEAETLCRSVGIINHGRIVTSTTIDDLMSLAEKEDIILYSDSAIPTEAAERLGGTLVGTRTMELSVAHSRGLNSVFAELGSMGVRIIGMKNRLNRLESLFMHLTGGEAKSSAPAEDDPVFSADAAEGDRE